MCQSSQECVLIVYARRTVSSAVSLACPSCACCRFSISSSSSTSWCPSRPDWVRSSSRTRGTVAVVLRSCWTFCVPRPTCPIFPCVHRLVRVPSSSFKGAAAQAEHSKASTKHKSSVPLPPGCCECLLEPLRQCPRDRNLCIIWGEALAVSG